MTVLIDSSAWIDYLAGQKKGEALRPIIGSDEKIITSAINLFEVYLKYLRFFPKEAEEKRRYIISRAEIIAVDKEIAALAAQIKLSRGIALADAVVWATAEKHGATLVTADSDFKGYRPLQLLR